jgi:hypothetical protein
MPVPLDKKESFRRGREAFFLFRGLSWSRGRNGKGGVLKSEDQPIRVFSTAPGEEKKLLLLLRGLLRSLLRSLLLLSHGATTSFQERNVKLGEFVVNDFLTTRHFFFRADSTPRARASTLLRARTITLCARITRSKMSRALTLVRKV